MLEGLQVLHTEKVCHKNLTATNALVVNPDDGPMMIKLSDFGMNTRLYSEEKPYFNPNQPPEFLLHGMYERSGDIWQAGIILF